MNTRFQRVVAVAVLLAARVGCAADMKELISKADAGDAAAQYELAMAYDTGRGVGRDVSQAALWCAKAAEQGHAEAQNCIGSMYQFGDGVPQNEATAAAWYEKAVAQGHGEAHTNLGYLYDLGQGVGQDRGRAVELYVKGAESGSVNAMLNLGISYQQGEGVAIDRAEAFKWLDLARLYTQRMNDMQLKWRVRGALDELRKGMSKAEIKDGQRRSKAWDAAHRHRRGT
jgi:uncharacterized protein